VSSDGTRVALTVIDGGSRVGFRVAGGCLDAAAFGGASLHEHLQHEQSEENPQSGDHERPFLRLRRSCDGLAQLFTRQLSDCTIL
jgi:hypothetical protein